jgi:hypothetical protein
MAAIINSTTEFLAKDIATNPIDNAANLLLTYSVLEDRNVDVRIDLGKTGGLLNGAAANFDILLRITRDGADVDIYYESTLTKRTAADTRWSYALTRPIAIRTGETLKVYAKSSNANDTDIDGDIYLLDPTERVLKPQIWYVDETYGSDTHLGHSATAAKATVASAAAAAANGDIIELLGPITTAVDLSAKTGITLRGQGWGTTITNAAADELIKLGAQCSLEKLAASNTKAAIAAGVIYGVRAYGANVRVRDCWIASTGAGISSAYDKMRVSRCAVDAGEYAVSFPSVAGTYYGYVDKSILVTSGWTICNSAAVFAQRTAVYVRDSILDVTIANSDSTHTPIGIYVLGAAIRTRCHCINTVMRIAATAGTYASGVRVSGPADAYVDGGYIYMVASGANVFSLDQLTTATLTVIDANYDTTITNGTIGQGGSGWAAAINAEVDTALDTAIPGAPTANSINERVAAIDNKLPTNYIMGSANVGDQDIIIHTGQVPDNTSTENSIKLAATASGANDIYNENLISLIGGTGAGQCRIIADYIGGTQTVAIRDKWLITPDDTTAYRITPFSGILLANTGLAADAGASTITLNASAPATADTFVGHTVFISAGTGVGQARIITGYTAERVATVSPAWSVQPVGSASIYLILPVGRTFVNAIAAGAITAASIAADAIDADALAADAVTEIWAKAMSDLAAGAPSATCSVLTAINYLYEMWRNKTVTDGTNSEIVVYKDNGTTKLCEADISDDGSLFTKSEFGAAD